MQIKPAEQKDLEQILPIYEAARRLMAQGGNPGQWTNGYPPEELLRQDIERGVLYKVLEGGRIVGVFAFTEGPEKDYEAIKGAWLDDGPYRVIHRLAASGAKGVAAAVFAWARTRTGSLRIDTHASNGAMRHLLEREGFLYVGDIALSDGSPRRAYHWLNRP